MKIKKTNYQKRKTAEIIYGDVVRRERKDTIQPKLWSEYNNSVDITYHQL